MWPLIMAVVRRYSPIFTFPIAAVVGLIGYKIEEKISSKYTPSTPAISQQRLERTLETSFASDIGREKIKMHSPLEVNLSPSLKT